MKRLLALLFLSIFCGLGLLAQEKKDLEPKLLGIPLGITKTEFEKRLKAIAPKASFTLEHEGKNIYTNTPPVSGFSTFGIAVVYARNKTQSYAVIFEEVSANHVLLDKHSRLKDLLSKKYGAPIQEDEGYDMQHLYDESQKEKSEAIVSGMGQIDTYWVTGKYQILLRAVRGQKRIALIYSDMEAKDLSDEDKMNDL